MERFPRAAGDASKPGRLLGILCTVLLAAACTINPVTGERQITLVSAADELAIGEAQYEPSQQMQGGKLVVDPAVSEYVSRVGRQLAAVSDRALPYEFVVLNNSVPNAWTLPGGKIAVNRGLLVELDSEAELAAVLGHEIVHAAARHGAQALQRGLLLQGVLLAAAAATGGNDYSNLAVGAAGVGAQLINQRFSRDAELEADHYGMVYMSRAGYDPQAAVSLQEKFVRLAQGEQQGWLAGLFASHPPSQERVERNRATAATLPRSGRIGREAYQAAIARLLQTRPAYEDYDQARAALAEGRTDDAERLARRAAQALPGEGHFHALLGDIDFARNRLDDAIRRYQDAAARNDRYFYYYLREGLAQQRLGQLDRAQANLEASVALLPTADAYLGLGMIAERRGDVATALGHYARAAESDSAAGRAAEDAMARLQLPDSPNKYLAVRGNLDSNGQLIVELRNPTRLAVADVTVTIRYLDKDGAAARAERVMQGPLTPNTVQRLATGLGPFRSSEQYELNLASARVVTP